MLQNAALSDNAFISVDLINAEDVQKKKIQTDVYAGKEPCYELSKTFNEQCDLLKEKLTLTCSSLNFIIPKFNNQSYLDILTYRIQTRFYANQTDLYYISLKKYLENLYFALAYKSISSSEAHDILNDLFDNLLVCGPGVFLHLNDAVSKLDKKFNLVRTLAELRKNIILKLAAQHCQRKNISSNNSAHVVNAFLAYAQGEGLNPLGGEEFNKMKEIYLQNANITENDYENFICDFYLQYHPQYIIEFLLEKSQKIYAAIVKDVKQKFQLKNGIIDISSENVYDDLCSIIANYGSNFTVAELFSAKAENNSLLQLRSHMGAVVEECISEKIFIPLPINCKIIEMSYLPSDQPILIIGEHIADDAHNYFFENKLWEHIRFHDFKLLNIALNEEALNYYKNNDLDNLKGVNVSTLIKKAVDTHNEALIISLFKFNAFNKENVSNAINYAANKKAWHIVKLIDSHSSPSDKDPEMYGNVLVKAANANQLDVVLDLLKAQALADQWVVDNDNTALHCAVYHDNLEMIQALIVAGADLNAMNADQLTPIAMAAAKSNWKIVNLIASLHETCDEDHAHYNEALIYAAKANEKEVVKHLLKAKALTEWVDNANGFTPLHYAVMHRNLEMVKDLLQTNANLSHPNKNKLTPIAHAAFFKAWDIVALLAENQKQNDISLDYGDALLQATEANQVEIVKLLLTLDKKSDWVFDVTDNTPLHCAVENKNHEIIMSLIEAGEDICKQNAAKLTPIVLAAKKSDWEIVRLIADSKKTNNSDAANYGQALLLAAKANQLNTVKSLLEANTKSLWRILSDGNNALHYAVLHQNKAMISCLVASKINFNIGNKAGLTPLDLAKEINATEIVNILSPQTFFSQMFNFFHFRINIFSEEKEHAVKHQTRFNL